MAEKTKKQINEEWNELYQYVKNEILKYGEDKSMPKYMVLRLKGFCDGNFMKNKKSKNQAKYEYTDILMTFKINKYKILNSMTNKTFKDEQHMFNYIMTFIENDINNVVEIIKRKEKSEQKAENVNTIIESSSDDVKAQYKKKTKEKKNSILDNLW